MLNRLSSLNSLKTGAKILLAVGLVYWVFKKTPIDPETLHRLFSPSFLIVSALLVGTNILLLSERWRRTLVGQGQNLRFWACLKLTYIGHFFNFAVPGGVGGDLVKAYYFASDRPQAKLTAVSSVMMDRFLGLFVMILMALMVMLYDLEHVLGIPTLRHLFYLIVTLGCLACVFFFLMFSERPWVIRIVSRGLKVLPFREKINKLYVSFHGYAKYPKLIAMIMGYSLVGQTIAILSMVYTGYSLGATDVPLSTYFLVAPLGFMAIAIPISPAGLGVGQAAFFALFNIYLERQSSLGTVVITTFQAFLVVHALVGAVFYLTRGKVAPVTQIESDSEDRFQSGSLQPKGTPKSSLDSKSADLQL